METKLNEILDITPFGIEKVAHRSNAMYIDGDTGRKSYSYNILYRDDNDPLDSNHKMTIHSDMPAFTSIERLLAATGLQPKEVDEKMLEKVLPPAFYKIKGCMVVLDLSTKPLYQTYSNNVVMADENGEPQIIHKKGSPIMAKDPETGKDTEVPALIESMSLWGFCKPLRKENPNDPTKYTWCKGNDPITKLQDMIRQGRYKFFSEYEKNHKPKDTGNQEPPAEENTDKPEDKGTPPPLNIDDL